MVFLEFLYFHEKINIINTYERLLLKSTIFVGVSFRKVSDFYCKQNRQLFLEGTWRYVFLKVPELLNDVIFQNSFEWLFLNTPQKTKSSTSAASVNVTRVRLPLPLVWNINLKSVREFVFNKTSNLYEGVCDGLCDGICFKLWAVRESVLRKVVSLY